MRALMWFRADLRLEDNTALHHACREATQGVVGVFAVCPEQWREHDWGGPRVDFLLRNLAALRKALDGHNIPLRLLRHERFEDTPGALLNLAHALACDALYFNREYEVNEARRDQAVQAMMREAGVVVRCYHDQTVLPPDACMTGAGGYYSVFTPYKRNWLATLGREGGARVYAAPGRLAAMACPADAAPQAPPQALPGFALDGVDMTRWPAGEQAARARLDRFVARDLEHYKQRRDAPALDGTSALSPYLALGVLSPRQCLEPAMQALGRAALDGTSGPATWISELVWREFYRHVLMGYPRVSMHRAFKPETERVAWRDDSEGFEAWTKGRTGVPIVDAAMRQLNQTGWMHNRLRMIAAMYLTKDLLIDWRAGERYFMQRLVDGDLANNNGGWQWSASTGVDAAPYFRIFNPHSQSRKCDPDGAFLRRYLPELADLDNKAIHEPPAGSNYPAPLVDHRLARQRALAAFKAL